MLARTLIQFHFMALELDRSKFSLRLHLQALRVPKNVCHNVSKLLSGFVLDRPRVKHVVLDPTDTNSRLVLLSDTVKDQSEIPEQQLDAVRQLLIDLDVVSHELVLDYEHWSADHVLRAILPSHVDVPSSFETIGHIAHLNLREEHTPYKKIIGTVILEKNQPKLKTVLNKVGTIENEFRVPTFEVLAGDDNLVTEVKQYAATFRLDYGLVYWNSRLEHEHARLVSQFRPGNVICDMFAGIGPFAIPAAQKGCLVYANDLNPASVKFLQENAKINNVQKRLVAYNLDARDFMKKLAAPPSEDDNTAKSEHVTDESTTTDRSTQDGEPKNVHVPQVRAARPKKAKKSLETSFPELSSSKTWERFDHVVMNLPASALEFLDVFNGLISRDCWKGSMPQIHCYCFMRSCETVADILKKAESYIGGSLPADASTWTVRNVAPNKTMLCISFNLPEAIALGEEAALTSGSKRPRTM